MTETVLDLQYPRSDIPVSYNPHMAIKVFSKPHLHCDESVIDKNFLRQEIGSDGCLVASAELLVDL
jgi:hypothetical protein